MDNDRAKELLTKMEDSIRTRLSSTPPEPECEVHDQTYVQEQLYDIGSLKDLFIQQGNALAAIHKPLQDQTNRNNASCTETEDMKGIRVDDEACAGGGSFGEPQDESSHSNSSFDNPLVDATNALDKIFIDALKEFSPDLDTEMNAAGTCSREKARDIDSVHFDESDSEIQAAIEEIRKEASQIDTIMALDQLKTVQSELEATTKALRQRSLEAEELKEQVEKMEERVACLELERDLYKADASKLGEDLKTCVDRMFDISCVAGDSSLESQEPGKRIQRKGGQREELQAKRGATNANIVKPLRDQRIVRQVSMKSESRVHHPAILASTPVEDANCPRPPPHYCSPYQVTPQETGPVTRRQGLPSCSDSSIVRRYVAGGPETRTSSHFEPIKSRSKNIFRGHRNNAEASHNLSHQMFVPEVASDTSRRQGPLADTSALRSSFPLTSTDSGKENRICGLFCLKQARSSSKKADIAAMRMQINQLHSMMKTSLQTSEKLRKRLALISRYYESVIQKLQEQLAESKHMKVQDEADFRTKLSELETCITITKLQSKLRKREQEVARLQGLLGDSRQEI